VVRPEGDCHEIEAERGAGRLYCITAATMLAPAQGRADFIFQDLTTFNLGRFDEPTDLTFNPSAINQFNKDRSFFSTLTSVVQKIALTSYRQSGA